MGASRVALSVCLGILAGIVAGVLSGIIVDARVGTSYKGVYIDPVGTQVLISCTKETAADGHTLLFCSTDDREAW